MKRKTVVVKKEEDAPVIEREEEEEDLSMSEEEDDDISGVKEEEDDDDQDEACSKKHPRLVSEVDSIDDFIPKFLPQRDKEVVERLRNLSEQLNSQMREFDEQMIWALIRIEQLKGMNCSPAD